MKRKYLQLFVCKKYWLVLLLSFQVLAAAAQPACPTLTPGTLSVNATSVCAGETVHFSLSGTDVSPFIMYFLEVTDSPSGTFNVTAAPITDPTLGFDMPAIPGTNYYRIREFCVFGQNQNTDTLTVTGKSMSGVYTINSLQPATATNFTSFSSAAEALGCGVSGPVVFEVTTQNANYNEQLIIPEIRGASNINTITFNGNGNTISFGSTDASNSAVIKLNGADYIIIDSLIVDATVGGNYGFGVQLINDADFNVVRRCIINVGVSSTSSSYAGVVINASDSYNIGDGSTLCDGNTIEGNEIIGGYYGMTLVGGTGDTNGTSNIITNNSFINNYIRDFSFCGIHVAYTDGTVIAGNRLSRPERKILGGFNSFIGIRFSGNSTHATVTGNRLFNPCGGNTSNAGTIYGILFEACDATSAAPNIVSNNLLYDFIAGGAIYALQNQSSDYCSFYHNTISIDSTVQQTATGNTAAFYFNAAAVGVEFKDNLISILRGGAGDKYGIYKSTAAIVCNSNNNNFYILPTATNYVGYNGSKQSTLFNWQQATTGDAASVQIDPLFLSPKEANYTPNNASLDNKGLPVGITTDITAAARNGATPDIGAYEFSHLVCTNPPTAGTVTVSQNPICAASTALLGMTGGDLGAGISFQWQSSLDNTNWTNVSATTNPKEAIVSQTADTWYRVVSTCGTGSTPSDAVQIHTLYGLSGNYTINKAVTTGGNNFQSFGDAWNAIKCGITGPVVFDVAPGSGPYNEQLLTSAVKGASAVNTITIKGNGNTLTYTSKDAFQRAVIELDGTDHLIIDNLVVKATAASTSTYGYGIHLTNDADSNIVRHCAIYADTTLTLYDHNVCGIAINGSGSINPEWGEAFSDGNLFEDNTVTGGYYGLTLIGNATNANKRNIIRRNTFTNFLAAGIYSVNAFQTIIDSNTISRPTRVSVVEFKGIYLTSGQLSNTITRNRISNPFGGNPSATDDFYGISVDAADASAGFENIISNNLIYNINGEGTVYGLYNSSSDRTWFYHNTVHLDGAPSGTNPAYGFYQTSAAAAIRFRNNIVTINRSGDGKKYTMYFATTGSGISSDNNDLYIFPNNQNANIGFSDGIDQKILANWQIAGNEASSTSVDPAYTDEANGNFQPKYGAVNNSGQPLPVIVDINGTSRNVTTPDMGAYEFTPVNCAAVTAGTAIASSDEICEGNKVQLNVAGNSIGGGQTYQWQAATSATGSFGAISSAQPNPIFNISPDVSVVYYRALVTCNGSTSYTQPITINVGAMLPGGIYTIDQNGTGNFRSFNEAKAAMACGIKGPVEFHVLPGGIAYDEQLVLGPIVGASAINTVTFKGNNDTIRYASTDFNTSAVITLNNASYIIFDSLVISAMGSDYYGVGVYLNNNADNNIFRKCTILIPQTSSSSSFAGVMIAGNYDPFYSLDDCNCDNNLFENNTIRGGYYGMGMRGGRYSPIAGNKFTGNTVLDFYTYGIFTGCTTDAVIEGNTISRPTRTSIGAFYGIYAKGESSYELTMNHGLRISKNKIYTTSGGNPASTSATYGIYLNSNDAYDYKPVIVSNNLLYRFNGAGAVYGIYNAGSDNARYYHNTIALDNKSYTGTTISYGIFQSSSVVGLDIKNNIITVLRGGTGSKFGFYFQSATAFTSDYNDIWVDNAVGTNKYTGYYSGTNKILLSDWRTVTPNGAGANPDMHSISRSPAYEDTALAKFKPISLEMDNLGTPVGITSDIDSKGRSTATPDIGAIEFSNTACTSPPTPGAAFINPASGMCMGTTVQLGLTGNSSGGSQKYVWQRAASAAGPWTKISDTADVSDLSYELVSKETYFRAVVVCGTGVAYSTPAQLTINSGLLAGDYTIDPSLPAGTGNFQSFKDAIAALHCGIEGAVRFLTAPGTYNERVRVPKVPGTSATATVTFLSKDNNAASVTLTAPCTIDTNYVLKLDTTNFIVFKNITIKAVGTDYARAVELTATSTGDSITGCIIDLPVVRNTATNVIGIYGNELSGQRNVISHNTITNGMAGIFLNGISLYAQRFVIDSNKVSNSYFYNIYAENINRVSVSGNTIVKDGIQSVRSYGVYLTRCDTAYQANKNNITITNTGSTVSGIFVFISSADKQEKGSISGNKITADATNSGAVTGLNVYTSTNNFNAMNNVIVIATTGNEAYGIYTTSSRGGCGYYNNSILIESATVSSAAGYFAESPSAAITQNGENSIYNNIFSNTGGGGVAMFIHNALTVNSDYNLLYSSGPSLANYNGNSIANLKLWQDASNWDLNSLVYKPAFVNNTTLAPDVTNANVWAIHGRGVQIIPDSMDINGNKRPYTLRTGVPDLGAYEFLPTIAPVALTAVPAIPVPNSRQTFMLGTDTVTQITWGNTVPATIEGKRYSGVAPDGLTAGQPYMYFYTAFTTTGTAPKGHTVKQFYIDSWRGFIDNEKTIKLGKTNATAAWEISAKSRLDTIANTVADTGLVVLNKFTGLTDGKEAPTDPVVINNRDTSNRGTRFWAPYANTTLFYDKNDQEMVFYFGAGAKEAHVTLRVNGTSWIKRYTVPANTAITSDVIPKAGAYDARLLQEGLSDRGISVESDVPVSAYAHIYGQWSSAATMLMPVGTYGYEYYTLTAKQTYNPGKYNASVVNVIAAYDSTILEITPSVPTQGGRAANVPFTVALKKGQVYQLIGAIDPSLAIAYDLTGTKIRSIKNTNNKCWPVAVFSGSNLTGFDCSLLGSGGTGDVIMQQNFPFQAWGKKYLTAPSSRFSDARILMPNVYRISVKDPATIVELNGSPLTNLLTGNYYQYASSTADYIKSDKPVMVAQLQPSAHSCGATDSMGDPEMFFISPLEQGVKETQLYRPANRYLGSAIDFQFITIVVPTKGLPSLTIDGINSYDYAYPHPNLAGYTVVVKRWIAASGQSVVKCDSSFTGITYGMGETESYGYNIGTMVLNLNTKVSLTNTHATSGSNDYTCAGTPFKLSLMTTVMPTAIDWELSKVPGIVPNADVHVANPVPVETLIINGITYYKYILNQEYAITSPGDYTVSAFITHPDIDACDSRQETLVPIKVLAAPVVDFVTTGSCAGSEIAFAGTAERANNSPITNWAWDFADAGAHAAAKDTVHKYIKAGDYKVTLAVIDANGCIADTVKTVTIKAPLIAPVVKAGIITSSSVSFSWDAVAGATGYEVSIDNEVTWVTPSSGATGLTHTITGLQLAQTVTIKVRALGSCLPAVSNAVSATTSVQEVFIPNSFSPDNNGPVENEYFKVYGNSIKQLRLMIFNQWGEKVFETTNKTEGWDGRHKGKPQPSGVYIYVADILLDNNKRETKKGTINLVR